MVNLIGEFDCSVDAKGRLLFPAGLKKQLHPDEQVRFVVNRSVFERALIIYPMSEWDRITKQLNKLNLFKKKNDEFVRKFRNGATVVEMDSVGRILIPRKLTEFADVDKKVVLLASSTKIELWSKDKYEEKMDADWDDFADLAEEVMGSVGEENSDDE